MSKKIKRYKYSSDYYRSSSSRKKSSDDKKKSFDSEKVKAGSDINRLESQYKLSDPRGFTSYHLEKHSDKKFLEENKGDVKTQKLKDEFLPVETDRRLLEESSQTKDLQSTTPLSDTKPDSEQIKKILQEQGTLANLVTGNLTSGFTSKCLEETLTDKSDEKSPDWSSSIKTFGLDSIDNKKEDIVKPSLIKTQKTSENSDRTLLGKRITLESFAHLLDKARDEKNRGEIKDKKSDEASSQSSLPVSESKKTEKTSPSDKPSDKKIEDNLQKKLDKFVEKKLEAIFSSRSEKSGSNEKTKETGENNSEEKSFKDLEKQVDEFIKNELSQAPKEKTPVTESPHKKFDEQEKSGQGTDKIKDEQNSDEFKEKRKIFPSFSGSDESRKKDDTSPEGAEALLKDNLHRKPVNDEKQSDKFTDKDLQIPPLSGSEVQDVSGNFRNNRKSDGMELFDNTLKAINDGEFDKLGKKISDIVEKGLKDPSSLDNELEKLLSLSDFPPGADEKSGSPPADNSGEAQSKNKSDKDNAPVKSGNKPDKKKEKVSSWITQGPGKSKEAKAARRKKKDDVKKAVSSGMDKKKPHKDIKDKAQSGRIFDGKEPLKDRPPVFGKPENSLSGKEIREDRKIDIPDEKLKSVREKEFSFLQSDEQKNIRKSELHFQSPEKSHLNALDSEKYHDEKKVDDKEKIEKSGREKEALPSQVISQKYEKKDVYETDGISDSEKKSGEAEKKEEVSSLAKEKIAEKPVSSLINTGSGIDGRDEKIIKDKKVEEFKEKGFPGEKPFGASLMPSAGLLKLPGKDRLPQKFTGKFSRFHRVGLLKLPGHGSSPQVKGDSKRLPEKTSLPEDKSKAREHLSEKLQTASKSGPIPQIGIGLMSREGLNLNTDVSKMKLPGIEMKSKGNIKLDIKPEVLQKFYGELKTSPEVAPETPEKSGLTAVADKSIFDKPGRQIDEFLEKDIKEKPSLKSEGKFFNVLDTFLQRDKKGDRGGTSPGHITEKLSGNMEKEIRKLVDRGLRETGLFASGLKKLLAGRGFSPDAGKKSEEGGIPGSRGIDFKKTSGKPGAKEKISGKRKKRNIQRKKKEALFSTGSKKTVKGPETTGGKRELKEKSDKINHKNKEEFSSQVSEKELSSGKSDSVTEKTLKEDKKVNVIEGETLRRSDDFREIKSDKIDSQKIVSPEDTKDISQDKKADKSENIIDKTSSEEIQKPDSILRSDGDKDTELTHNPGDKNTEEKEPSLSKADLQDLYQKSESQPGETSGKDEPEKTGKVKEVKPDEPEEKKRYSEQPFGPSLLPSAGLLKLPGLDRLPVKPGKGLMPLHRVALMSLPATGFPGKIGDKPLQVKPDMNSQTLKKSVPEKREQDGIRPQAGPIPQISVGHMSPHPGTASVAFQGKEKIKLPGISMKSGIDKGMDPEKGISQKPRTIKDEQKTHESTEKLFSHKDKKAEDKPEEKKASPSVEKVEKDSGKDIKPAEKEVKDKKVEADKPEIQKEELKSQPEVKLPSRAEGKSSEAFCDRIEKTDSELSMLKEYKNAKTDEEKEKIASDYEKLTDKKLKADTLDKDIRGLEKEKHRLESIDGKNKEYNKCIDGVCKVDKESSLLKEYQSATGNEDKKAIAENYKKLTGRDLKTENIDRQLKDLDGSRNKLVDEAKKTYDEQLKLLKPAERKKLEKSEKSYNQTAGDLAGLNKEKIDENKSFDKDMKRLNKELEGLEPGSREYEKKSQEIQDRRQAHTDFEDKLSAKEQDTIEKRKELEKLQGELGTGLRQPELTGEQEKKYSAIDDMYRGATLPDKSNPVENMINKAKVTDEFVTSGLFSSSQLEVAKNEGATITVAPPGETSGKDDREKRGEIKEIKPEEKKKYNESSLAPSLLTHAKSEEKTKPDVSEKLTLTPKEGSRGFSASEKDIKPERLPGDEMFEKSDLKRGQDIESLKGLIAGPGLTPLKLSGISVNFRTDETSKLQALKGLKPESGKNLFGASKEKSFKSKDLHTFLEGKESGGIETAGPHLSSSSSERGTKVRDRLRSEESSGVEGKDKEKSLFHKDVKSPDRRGVKDEEKTHESHEKGLHHKDIKEDKLDEAKDEKKTRESEEKSVSPSGEDIKGEDKKEAKDEKVDESKAKSAPEEDTKTEDKKESEDGKVEESKARSAPEEDTKTEDKKESEDNKVDETKAKSGPDEDEEAEEVRDSNETAESTDKKEELVETIQSDPEASEKFEQLAPEDQEKVLKLAEDIKSQTPDGEESGSGETSEVKVEASEKLVENVTKLLKEDKLTQTDSEGKTVLDNLTEMKDQKAPEELAEKKSEIVAQVVDNIANPETINQGDRDTCAAAVVEYKLAKEDAGEYTKIAKELTSKEGEAGLKSGEVLKRDDGNKEIGDKGCLEDDGSGRKDVSRIMQSSITEHANQDKDYVTKKDEVKDNKVEVDKTDKSKDTNINPDGTDDGAGLTDKETEKAIKDIFAKDASVVAISNDRTAEELNKANNDIEKTLKDGETVPVKLQWGEGSHELTVEKMDDKYVYMKNPWGDKETGKGGPEREVLDDKGHIRMTREEFDKSLKNYTSFSEKSPETQKQEIKRESEVKLPPRAEGKSSEAFQDRIKKTDSELSMLKDYKNAKTDGEKEKIAGDYKKLTDKDLKAENVDKDIKGLESEKQRLENIDGKNKEYNKCIDDVGKADRESSLLKEYQSTTGDDNKKAIAEDYKELTGRELNPENIDKQLKDLDGNRNKLVDQAKKTYDEQLNLLTPAERKELEKSEKSYNQTAGDLAGLNKEKTEENKSLDKDMQRLKKDLEGLEPGSKEYEKKSQEIKDRWQAHTDFEDKLSAKEQDTIEKRKELEKLQGEMGIGLRQPELTEDQQKKYSAVDNMYTGTIPPDKSNPVENMINKAKVTDELATSGLYSSSQLEAAKNMGTTITVTSPGEKGFHGPGGTGGFVQGDRIYLSGNTLKGTAKQEMSHIIQSKNIKGTEQAGRKQLTQDEFFEKFKGTNSQDLKKITGTEKNYFKPGGKVDKKKDKEEKAGVSGSGVPQGGGMTPQGGSSGPIYQGGFRSRPGQIPSGNVPTQGPVVSGSRGQQTYQSSPGSYSPSTPQSSTPSGSVNQGPGGTSSGPVSQGSGGLSPSGSAGQGSGGLSSSGPGIHGDTSSGGAGSQTGGGTAAGGIGSSSYISQPDFLDKESDLKDKFSADEEELKPKEAGDNDGVEEGQDNKSGKDGREIKEDKDNKKIKTEEESKKIKAETDIQKTKTDEMEKKIKADTDTQKTKTEIDTQKTKTDTDTQKPKTETDTQKIKTETETQKTKADTDIQKVKAETDAQKIKSETDMQKIKTETDGQKTRPEGDTQKTKAEADMQKIKTETDMQKTKAEADMQKIKTETDGQKTKAETDMQKIKAETESQKIGTGEGSKKIQSGEEGNKTGKGERDGRSSFSPESQKAEDGREGQKIKTGDDAGKITSDMKKTGFETEGQKNKAGTESQTSRPVDEASKPQTSKGEVSARDMNKTAEGEKQIKSSESVSQNKEIFHQTKSGDAVKATAEQTQKTALSEQMQKISSQEVQKSSPQNIQKPEDLQKPAGPGLISRPSGLQEDKKVPPQQPVISQEGNKTSVTQKGQTVTGQSQSLQQGFRPAVFETGNKELSGQQLQKSVLTQDAPKAQKTPEAVAPQPVLKPVTMKNDEQTAVLQLGRKLTAPQDIQQVQRSVIQEGQKSVTQESQKPVIQDTQKSVDLQSQKTGINQQGQKIATPLLVQKPVAPLWEQKNVLPDQQVQKALSSQETRQSSILHDLKTQGSQEIQKSVTPQNLSKPVLQESQKSSVAQVFQKEVTDGQKQVDFQLGKKISIPQEGQKPVISQESQKSSLSQLSRKEVVLQPVQKSVDPQQSQKTSVSDRPVTKPADPQLIAQSDGKKVLTSQQITEQKLLAEGQKPSVLRAKPEGEISQQIKGEKLLREGQKPSVFSSEKKPFSLQDIQKVVKAEGQKSIIPQDAQKPGLTEGIKKSDHVQQANKTDLSGPVRTDDQVKSRLQKLDQIRVDAAKDNSLKIAGKEGEASKGPSLIKGGEGIKGIKENRGLKMNDALAGLKELKKEAFSGLKSTKMDKQTAEMFKSPGNQKISDRYGFLAGLKGDSKTGKAFNALTGMINNLPGKDLKVLQKNLTDKTMVSGGLKGSDSQKNSGPVVKKSFVNTFKSLSGEHALFKKEIIETSQKRDAGKRVTTEKQSALPQNEGLFKKIGNLVKNTIKSLSGGISINRFLETLGRRTGLSVNSMEMLRGNDKVGNLKELQKNVEVLNTTSVTGFKNQIKEIFKALTSKPFSPDAGQALAKRAGLSVNSMELLGGNNDRVKSLKNSMEQAFKPQFSQAFKETALKDASYVEKGGKGAESRAGTFKEGLARGLNIDISNTFKALSNKPVVQKSFVNLLQERTGKSINTVSLFKGNTGNIKDLNILHTRLTKLSMTDELGLHKGIFITDEEIKNRKKHLSREMENSMEWDRTKYVSLSPSDLQVESKLKLLRLCQMCQAPVTVDIVLCPSCARLRRQIYTELKVFYSKNSEKNYFDKPMSNVYNSRSSMEDTSKVIGKGRETLNLSMDAVNLFDTQEPGEVLTLRKEQMLPKMKDILALSRGNSMFTDRQILCN